MVQARDREGKRQVSCLRAECGPGFLGTCPPHTHSYSGQLSCREEGQLVAHSGHLRMESWPGWRGRLVSIKMSLPGDC